MDKEGFGMNGVMGYWVIGLLGYWVIGLLGYWVIGLLGYEGIEGIDYICRDTTFRVLKNTRHFVSQKTHDISCLYQYQEI